MAPAALCRPDYRGALTKAINPQVRLHMDYWEQSLAASEWFAGPEFTAADIQMSFPLEVAAARAGHWPVAPISVPSCAVSMPVPPASAPWSGRVLCLCHGGNAPAATR
ncbi:hypothetical protein RAA17_21420 [Komagataeibacter rhaeticus]|nr:hypothetical protein [Komagataeibacter rhaeticus]